MQTIKKFQLGKSGLTENFVEFVRKAFENCQIVKIEILKSCCRDKDRARKIGDKIAERLGKNFNYKLIGYVLILRKWRKNVRD